MKDDDLIWIRRSRGLPQPKVIAPNRCDRPWKVVNVDCHGRVFVCLCDGWVPWSVGHVMEFESFDEIFGSTTARRIQDSISAGTYDYCDVKYCGVEVVPVTVDYDYSVSVGIDDSCNLQCPSCRPDMRFSNDPEFVRERSQWADRINHWIQGVPQARVKVLVSSNGDPFASEIYRHFMRVQWSSGVNYDIRTNGLLIKKHLGTMPIVDNLQQLEISIDAATADVYHDVRRPGRWSTLIENLDFVEQLRTRREFRVIAFFVIQRANLGDVLPFIDLCERYRMIPGFTLLQDWSSWPDFSQHAVHDPGHPLYPQFVQTIKHPRFVALNLSWVNSLQIG